jgi:peptidyl-prolyl cis-trans isomerase B (cyclophilin B)
MGNEPVVEAPAAVGFEWPEDPSHPILTLEIENDVIDDASRDSDEGPPAGPAGKGTIEIELMPELAPVSVAHVIDLAKDGYYDGTTFHRVIPGFMIQGGDPNTRDRDPSNDGNGNPSMRIDDEFGNAPFVRGVVGMGNLGRSDSTGSQFFIMHADNRSLDGRYTVIGRVVSGIEVVDEITRVSIDRIGRWGPKDRPIENVLMKRVAIKEQTAGTNRVTQRSGDAGNAAEG